MGGVDSTDMILAGLGAIGAVWCVALVGVLVSADRTRYLSALDGLATSLRHIVERVGELRREGAGGARPASSPLDI